MQGTKCRRIVSLLVLLCMVVSLLPIAAIADDTEPTYEYVGARLDKEHDGTAVSVDVTKDIAVNGKTGILTSDSTAVVWREPTGAPLSAAPSDAGMYTMELSVTDESGNSSTVLTVGFVIWEKGHVHTFGRWTPNNDGKTHSHTCTSDEANAGCGYVETEPHHFGEWQPVASYGQEGEYQYRVCADCGFSEERTGVYTVTYNYETNGGTSASVTSKEAEYDTTVDLTPTATKSGYEFVGWNTDKDAHEALLKLDTVKGDITLYAIFKKTQNVRFYSQNGSLQATVPADVYNNETKAFYELTSDYPNGLYPENYEGYRTQGWSTDTEATNENLVDLHDVDGSPMIPDVTKDYYAVYARVINLTYDTDDKYGSWYETQTQYFNSAGNYSEAEFDVSILAATTVVEDFLYWAEGSKTGEKYNPGDKIKITEDTTLYAVYEGDIPEPTATPTAEPTATPTAEPTSTPTAEPTATPTAEPTATPTAEPTATPTAEPTATPTAEPTATPTAEPTATPAASYVKMVYIRFYSGTNGTIQTTIGVASYEDGSRGVFQTKTPVVIDGWNAIGWRTDDKTEAPEYEVGEYVTSGSALNYYAVYSRDLTVSYNTDGGSAIEKESKTQYLNSSGGTSKVTFTLPAAPAKAGDTFKSWAIGSKTGEKYDAGDTITVSEDTEIYAVWQSDERTLKKYTVTYDYTTNGGTSITAPTNTETVVEGDKLALINTNTTATKEGWTFAGWNTDPNAKEGLEYIKADGDITLYAIFKKEIIAKVSDTAITAELYNNATSAVITLPEPPAESGWEANGWRDESGAEYKSGAVRISGNTTFTPSYKKVITLVYDTNGSLDSIAEQSAVVYKNGSQTASAAFTLANAPVRNGYEFTSWAVSSNPTRGFGAGENVTLMENAVATAQWNKIELPPEKMTVTYDYKTNGGTNISATAPFASVEKGARADLTFKSEKDGWEFVGWNTDKDAHEALTSLEIKEDTTLYAIFKKDIRASFYDGETLDDAPDAWVNLTLYNNDESVTFSAPKEQSISGWTFDGWRSDKHTIAGEYRRSGYYSTSDTIKITISESTVFYAVYSRRITANGEELTQYRNTGGGIESKTIVLDEPKTTYDETTNERFAGWEVTVTDENGNETTTVYDAGAPITVSGTATVKAKTVKIPDGATLPTVETVSASVSSETSATLSKTVTHDNVSGNEIIKQGFVYWSKLSGGTKYTVTADGDTADLSSLSPETEYYYYAFAENAAGIGKGTIKKFTTESDTLPNAIMISPEYVSVEKGGIYQLLATLLPDTAKNSGIVWSSSNEKIAAVDQEGKVTGISAGQAVITATTEVGRLTAECIVDVTEAADLTPMNFSEWHMASHTSRYAQNGIGFDWDTADADGGNHQIATAYLARWEGAVDETNDPYPDYDGDVASNYKTVNEDYHVQNVEWLPKRTSATDNDEIKSALMKYGAVYSLMCVDWDCFDDEEGYNYYCPDEINYGGHAITIVGWDDNYQKTKFKSTPAGNGAFICKNSWGDGWGDDGYFYVSYYDAQLGRMDSSAVVTGIETNTGYNTIYQYDPLGAIGYIGFAETTYAANVFPEKGKTLTKDETLHAVSFYTYQKNTSYDVYIITDYTDSSSLTKLHNASATGVIENAGYHTVNLKTPVTLKSGTRFAVVVRFDTPGEDAYVYCEYPVEGYSSNAQANKDESYYSYNGKYWEDLTDDIDNANFCIKAFTDNGSVRLSSAIDNSERSYENDKVYTLSEAVDMGMPISDEYIEYFENKENGEDTIKLMSEETDRPKALGSTPSIVKAGANSVTFTDGSLFPTKYDLRDMGILSPVKDQGTWGTCWAHSMYASLESNILRKQKTTSSETDEAFTLSRTGLTMSQGSAVTLAKRIKPADLTDKSVVWLSSNEDAATVDTNGTVRAVGSGTATISAALRQGGLVAQCSVVVEDDEEIEETIEFEEKRIQKEIDDVFMVAYSVTPAKADSVYTWISDNTNVAAVNENGVITTKANGTAEISIMSGGEIKDTVTVVVGDGFNIETGSIDETGLILEDSVLSGKVSVNINNNASSAKPSSVILAVYDNETGAMTGIVAVPKLLTSGENTIEFNDISFDGITKGGYTLKCFAWNSFGNISPLSRTSEKSIIVE